MGIKALREQGTKKQKQYIVYYPKDLMVYVSDRKDQHFFISSADLSSDDLLLNIDQYAWVKAKTFWQSQVF